MKLKSKDGILRTRSASYLSAHPNRSLPEAGCNDLQLGPAIVACGAREPDGEDACGSHSPHRPRPPRLRGAGPALWGRGAREGACALSVWHTCAHALLGCSNLQALAQDRCASIRGALRVASQAELRFCFARSGPGAARGRAPAEFL